MDHINFSDIYKNWDSYPLSRLLLIDPQEGFGERVWVRQFPNRLVGIDDTPLWGKYRWQDICRVYYGSNQPEIVHRRWNARIWFWYHSTRNEPEDRSMRERIAEALEDVGHLSFFFQGTGYIYLEEQKDALNIVQAQLAPLDFMIDMRSEEEEEERKAS